MEDLPSKKKTLFPFKRWRGAHQLIRCPLSLCFLPRAACRASYFAPSRCGLISCFIVEAPQTKHSRGHQQPRAIVRFLLFLSCSLKKKRKSMALLSPGYKGELLAVAKATNLPLRADWHLFSQLLVFFIEGIIEKWAVRGQLTIVGS